MSDRKRIQEGELSSQAKSKILTWDASDNKTPIERPSWDDIYLSQAFVIAKRSHDAQTQCGCILVNQQHQPLSQGFNGFPRDLPDWFLPNLRPEKYPWMLHAEVNALVNCNSKPTDAIAYITGNPCFNCSLLMWQFGVREVVYTPHNVPHMTAVDDEYDVDMEIFVWLTEGQLKMRKISPNFEHHKEIYDRYQNWGV